MFGTRESGSSGGERRGRCQSEGGGKRYARRRRFSKSENIFSLGKRLRHHVGSQQADPAFLLRSHIMYAQTTRAALCIFIKPKLDSQTQESHNAPEVPRM